MPGPYAHITLLHELTLPAGLPSLFSPSSGFESALTTYFPYCTLGAVSPDYPNLAGGNGAAAQWADAMHYTRACEMMTRGIERVGNSQGVVRDKQLAWLLGYCAHVATDVTIHPVVRAKVGEYAENRRQHRICEMNQDGYIYRRMNLGEIGESDYFALTVAQCSNSDDGAELDHDIVALWEGMLADVHPDLFEADPPDTVSWHRELVAMAARSRGDAVRLFPLAGVIAAKMELAYPAYKMVDRQFIEELAVPSERPLCLHYDEIFDHAVGNVGILWKLVERAVCAEDPADQPTFGDWNLDNGCDEHGRLVFWE
ncbi:MAG: zinc dependent phospholipase C family protein [Desulfuromonadales bacterium]